MKQHRRLIHEYNRSRRLCNKNNRNVNIQFMKHQKEITEFIRLFEQTLESRILFFGIMEEVVVSI